MTLKQVCYIASIFFIFVDLAYSQIHYNSIELPEITASDSITFNIIRIKIIGNNKTKDHVILRELYFDAGDQVKLKDIFLAQKRILNLFLFNRVIFDLIGDKQEAILIITVAERWYVFPLPVLYINDRSWSKISYGAKLLYYNFLGRNILLNFTATFGYNPQFKFSYRNPWFGGKLKLLTNLSLFKSRVKCKSLNFQQIEDQRIGFEWLIGRRFGHFFYLTFQIGYMELQQPEITLSLNGKDKLPSLSINLQYDNRDLKEYPHKGYNILLWGKHVKCHHPINYYRYGIDLRCYLPAGSYSTLALRGSTDLSHGIIPRYDRVFFGYSERIRGNFYQKYEGENLISGGAELRIPLTKIHYYDLTEFAPPGFDDYYRNLKFGVSVGIFYDYGAIWYQHENLNKKHFHYGFGAGLHFHLPYIDLLRLELAFDKQFNREFIGEIRTAF